MADIWIAGVKVARPAKIDVGRFDITKSERTGSGKMTMEIVRADIRRVDVTWQYMLDDDLKAMLDTIAANKPFFTLKYPDAGKQETIVCYVGDISISLWHTVGGVKRWESVQIPFIEQ